jgi:phosphoglycolate phosphatase
VLFDLDGTLVDSFPGIAMAYSHVIAEMGLDGIDDAGLRQLIGPPIHVAFHDHFGLSGDRLEEAVLVFRKHYGSNGLFRFSKYPGVEAMLFGLKDHGFDLNVATSKLRTLAVDVLTHAGWIDLFTVVGGAEPDGSRYLKRDVIEWTVAQVANEVEVVAMVGDRAADIIGARELGLPGIGVSWGYGSAEELDEAGATMTAETPDQLLSALIGLH